MKNLSLILSVIITLFFNIGAHSAEQLKNKTIQRIYQYESLIVVSYFPPSSNADGCSKPNAANSHFAIPLTKDAQSGVKKGLDFYATVLAAKIDNLPIGAGVNGCSAWGTGTIPVLYRVDLY